MKKIIILVLSIILAMIITYNVGYKKCESDINKKNKELQNSIIYQVEVKVAKINLRKSIDLNSEIIKEVYKGQKLEAVEYFEGNKYNWYKVIYAKGKAGWIASGKTESWVEVVK